MAVSAQFMLNMSGLLGCWDWDERFILRSAGPCESERSMVILLVINNLIQNSDEPFWFQVLGKKQSL